MLPQFTQHFHEHDPIGIQLFLLSPFPFQAHLRGTAQEIALRESRSVIDQGWKEPRCVDACPTNALRFGEEEELKEYIAKAEILHPEFGAKPRTYYIGLLDKYFVAGAVYDPEEDECLEGATCTLTNTKTKEKFSTKTDNFGDFWFEKLDVGTYNLSIKKDGYYPFEQAAISTEKDVNLGDIKLNKKPKAK